MAIGSSALCGTFKREILAGIHFWTAHTRTGSSAISADTFKIAMFTNSASIDADTTGYTTSNEVSGTGYSAGGAALASVTLGLADNSSSVPTTPSSVVSVAASISELTGSADAAYTPPASKASTTSITHTPVSTSPARIARSTGAAPRHRGNNEK